MSQATLFNYQQVTPSDFYHALSELGYVDGCKSNILRLLWDCQQHSLAEIRLTGGAQYNARILELRREGWEIVNERTLQPLKSYYRLKTKERRLL